MAIPPKMRIFFLSGSTCGEVSTYIHATLLYYPSYINKKTNTVVVAVPGSVVVSDSAVFNGGRALLLYTAAATTTVVESILTILLYCKSTPQNNNKAYNNSIILIVLLHFFFIFFNRSVCWFPVACVPCVFFVYGAVMAHLVVFDALILVVHHTQTRLARKTPSSVRDKKSRHSTHTYL